MMRSHRHPQRRRRGSHRLPQRSRTPPELMDDAIAEILLRLPSDEPACLVRASLVCKLWHRILSEPTFPDRYRKFHQTPPLLGFLACYYSNEVDESAERFVPTTPTHIPFQQPVFGCQPLDCRHGRVLLDMVDGPGMIRENLAVWDPITGDHKLLSNPNQAPVPFGQSGAVLCAAAGCNHRGCHSGPFQVVLVSITSSYSYIHGTNNAARAWVYSSETLAWSTPVSVQIQYDGLASINRKHAAIVGEQIYFLLDPGAGILKYDHGKGCLTMIGAPCKYTYRLPGMLMAMEDGSLGFAGIMDDLTALHLWARKVNANESMGWVQDRVILINNLSTVDTYNKVIDVAGFAEGVDILLLSLQDGRGIMFELKSGRFRILGKPDEYIYCDEFVPYLSFYIPDFGHK